MFSADMLDPAPSFSEIMGYLGARFVLDDEDDGRDGDDHFYSVKDFCEGNANITTNFFLSVQRYVDAQPWLYVGNHFKFNVQTKPRSAGQGSWCRVLGSAGASVPIVVVATRQKSLVFPGDAEFEGGKEFSFLKVEMGNIDDWGHPNAAFVQSHQIDLPLHRVPVVSKTTRSYLGKFHSERYQPISAEEVQHLTNVLHALAEVGHLFGPSLNASFFFGTNAVATCKTVPFADRYIFTYPPKASKQKLFNCSRCNGIILKNDRVICGECKSITYCSTHCQVGDDSDHQEKCALWQTWRVFEARATSILRFFTFKLGTLHGVLDAFGVREKGIWARACSCNKMPFGELDISLPNEEFWCLSEELVPKFQELGDVGRVTSWEDYYKIRNLPSNSPVAAFMSFPLTVYHALIAHGKIDELDHSKPLVIHIIDAEIECDVLCLFQELLYLLPGVSFEIMMCGDKIGELANGKRFECDVEDQTMVIEMCCGSFEEMKTAEPDFIFGLNCEFEEKDVWESVLMKTQEYGVPSVFTFRSIVRVVESAEMVAKVFGCECDLDRMLNPFRSPLMIRSKNRCGTLAMNNGFLLCVGV